MGKNFFYSTIITALLASPSPDLLTATICFLVLANINYNSFIFNWLYLLLLNLLVLFKALMLTNKRFALTDMALLLTSKGSVLSNE